MTYKKARICMPYQMFFKRYELKYLISDEQKEAILTAMNPYMIADKYGRSTIRNIYFDTDNYRLIRRSIEKPIYKEKLRIRSYSRSLPESTVFVELKKKYKNVVYKRRISMTEKDAMSWVCGARECTEATQISDEIEYFMRYYGDLRPSVFLSYDREAFFSQDDVDFRVTFDNNILARIHDLSLTADVYGTPMLDAGNTLMEIKCSGGIPMWMVAVLSEERIFKTSFSKYGKAYQTMIFPDLFNKSDSVIMGDIPNVF